MEKSSLYQLIRSLSPVEIREVIRFLQSPFFNQRKDVLLLFEWMVKTENPQTAEAWKLLYDNQPFEDKQLRLIMSYLHRLLEHYLTIQELTRDEVLNEIHLSVAYRRRQMHAPFKRTQNELEKTLEKSPLRNGQYLENQFKMEWEAHQLAYTLNPTDLTRLKSLSDKADAAYLARKLQIICLMTAHQSVYTAEMQHTWQEEVIAKAEAPEFLAQPAIHIFLSCYYMLRYPQDEAHFRRFKDALLQQADTFPDEEMHGLFILAINYCVRRLNAGNSRYYQEVLDMYKQGLLKNYLLENGFLSRFTYLNIAAAALQTGELDWAQQFIEDYKNKLEKRYRESAYSYNMARLEYTRHRYDSVLELLQKANYRDPLLNLGAKTLLLKTCYETQAFDLMQSQADAMRNYIHRKRVLGYHRTNYLNIIRYAEKLMRLDLSDKTMVTEFATAVNAETVLSEKAFFLKAVNK